MTAIAVDIGPNIEAVLDQTLELNLPGLVTLALAFRAGCPTSGALIVKGAPELGR
jgi:hypothetical protein